jgi:phosphoglycerate kinase
MRFFTGEKTHNPTWTELFNNVASTYVNDAFSMLHRNDASITKIPLLCQKKAYGFQIKKELSELQQFHTKTNQPFCLIAGGNKSDDKIQYLKKFITKPEATRPKTILMGGLFSIPFLIAQKKLKFTYDETLIKEANQILLLAEQNKVNIILPIDHVYFDDKIIDIGPKTIDLYTSIISTAQTILCNGTMGKYEDPAGQQGTKEIVRAINKNNGFSVIGGGNTVDAAKQFLTSSKIDLISTGGGALLAYVTTENPENKLPGLLALQTI